MSRVLFVMLHPGFIRYYDDALLALADAGHDVHLAFEISRDKLGESVLAQRLEAASPRITCGTTPARSESVREFLVRGDRTATRSGDASRRLREQPSPDRVWDSLATTVRLMLDYLRFFEPEFAQASKLRDRAEKRVPRVYVAIVRAAGRAGSPVRRAFAGLLHAIEQAIPASAVLKAFVSDLRPDLLLVTPLIELGSQQVDYVKAARRLGIRSALCVASWDNLTSKGLIRVVPDHVIVWNEAQKSEAVSLHGVPPDRVIVTGAQVFDRWFAARPSRSRAEFCRRAGLDPDRPFVLYVGSSTFIAPEEVPFAERWMARLRGSNDAVVAGAGVLIRPHPANERQWRALDPAAWPNTAVWPAPGSDPNSADAHADYFDSLHHSAAVVGINTSAQLEAGIVGRPVFTVRVPEFAHSQDGTLHFKHLVEGDRALVRSAATLEEHVTQLGQALREEADAGTNRSFVRSFIRPFGEDVPAVPRFVAAVETLASQPPPAPRRASAGARAARPLIAVIARVAGALAEERPLWVYPARPVIAARVHVEAWGYRTRAAMRRIGGTLRASRRRVRRSWYESTQRRKKYVARLNKRARNARGVVKRVVRRAATAAAGEGRKNA